MKIHLNLLFIPALLIIGAACNKDDDNSNDNRPSAPKSSYTFPDSTEYGPNLLALDDGDTFRRHKYGLHVLLENMEMTVVVNSNNTDDKTGFFWSTNNAYGWRHIKSGNWENTFESQENDCNAECMLNGYGDGSIDITVSTGDTTFTKNHPFE
ncbi:hypothetical protein [Salibacter halophilus]|uniref:Uncharacterized protein n=1 Tax=Salibacter halophilus TaxID=1803916 RepID=A0A6N6M8T4_9FLAO|nr:hypothetical protein [Salibacter halophilus]KAB1064805.1 hypothetical protein F3059_05465 [Salibacter halophilus]